MRAAKNDFQVPLVARLGVCLAKPWIHIHTATTTGELAKKTDEIVALEERVLKLEEENDQQIREHESKMVHKYVGAALCIVSGRCIFSATDECTSDVRVRTWNDGEAEGQKCEHVRSVLV